MLISTDRRENRAKKKLIVYPLVPNSICSRCKHKHGAVCQWTWTYMYITDANEMMNKRDFLECFDYVMIKRAAWTWCNCRHIFNLFHKRPFTSFKRSLSLNYPFLFFLSHCRLKSKYLICPNLIVDLKPIKIEFFN